MDGPSTALGFLPPCPGRYCGYGTGLENPTCGACPRGHRSIDSICVPCNWTPSAYDIMFLTVSISIVVMVTAAAVLRSIRAASSPASEGGRVHCWLFFGFIFEVTLSLIFALMSVEPLGQLTMVTCNVTRLGDWYSALDNPVPNHRGQLHCANEAAYPLITWVLFFDLYSACFALLLRLPLLRFLSKSKGPSPSLFQVRGDVLSPCFVHKCTIIAHRYCHWSLSALRLTFATGSLTAGLKIGYASIYRTLYSLPVHAILHVTAGGLIYYSFPFFLLAFNLLVTVANMADPEWKVRQPSFAACHLDA